ncbi:uncharacterized protein DUF4363 [Anaerobacterium chartisolvens]|uniref:Uncharacterized protein DUF4363 n=1 Tax=Anaerobacterium chartisolvens TaxID=1297424 RepID=A0A369AWK8_9FIRM|nr:DUF4363 family protein [Anaerobacterium chartisolvens]RCX13780.1 uncharacterized protein DUF4363 [Anaerobacterium chartisolvens]
MHTLKIAASIAVLLVLIITAGIYTNHALLSSSKKLEAHIIKIEEASKSEKWASAKEQLDMANALWDNTEGAWSVLIDHIEIDNIKELFVRTEKYIETQNQSMTLAETAALKQCISNIPKKENFNIKNIF